MRHGLLWMFFAFLLVAGGIDIWLKVHLVSRNSVDPTAIGLLEGISLALAFGLSFFFGQRTREVAAADELRSHGRTALRRILNLYGALERLSISFEEEREGARARATAQDDALSLYEVNRIIDVFAAQLEGQMRTAADVIDDWRDVLPNEVGEIEAQARERRAQNRDGYAE